MRLHLSTVLQTWLLAGAVALLAGACGRPFVEEAAPLIEVVSPDFDEVFLDDRVPVRLRVTSFRDVARVEVDGRAIQPLGDDAWGDTLRLRPGLSAHVVRAFDAEGLESRDTLMALYLPFHVEERGGGLPDERGGHTATLLPDGRVLVAGGTPRRTAPALASALLLDPDRAVAAPQALSLTAARTGHTATLLPDGRVLLVGGSRTDTVRTQMDLVERVEVFDPATGRFQSVPVVGTPIRRAFHAAVLRPSPDGSALDLLGGWTATAQGRPYVRSDVRSFVFRDDTLFARNVTFSFGEALTGLTATPLVAGGGAVARRFLLAGSYFTRGGSSTVSYVIDYGSAIGIDAVGALRTPRTRHAAVALPGRLAFVVGGRGASTADVLAAPEVYAGPVRRFFRYPDPLPASMRMTGRFGHTATILPAGRILLLGGYTASGNGTGSTAYITLF